MRSRLSATATGPTTLYGDHHGSASVAVTSSGTVQRMRYKPWGEARGTSASAFATDRLYTGQIYDGDTASGGTGLYFYNARYYDPALGRFTQADSIVPDPGTPMAFDRYAYTLNNPVRYTDPSGHCPTPSSNSGNVVCVDLFIMTETIGGGFGHGDDRWFSWDSEPWQSRGYLYVYLDEDGYMYQYNYYITASCTIIGCYGPYLGEYNWFDVWQDPTTKDIHVQWKLTNGFSAFLDIIGQTMEEFMINNYPRTGLDLTPYGLQLAAAALQPINGSMTIGDDDADGRYEMIYLDRDPYPSLEVYHYYDGKVQTVITRRQESWGPFIGLSPMAPNDRWR